MLNLNSNFRIPKGRTISVMKLTKKYRKFIWNSLKRLLSSIELFPRSWLSHLELPFVCFASSSLWCFCSLDFSGSNILGSRFRTQFLTFISFLSCWEFCGLAKRHHEKNTKSSNSCLNFWSILMMRRKFYRFTLVIDIKLQQFNSFSLWRFAISFINCRRFE